MKVDLSCPIELWEYQLPDKEKPACSFTFYNLNERSISSIQITVTLFDDKGAVLSRRLERPMALDAKGRRPFVVTLDTQGLEVDAADLTIDKAWFDDGSEWRRAQEARLVDYAPNELPPNRRQEQLRYIAGPDAIGYPSDQGAVWICVCGRVNAAEEAHCRRCLRGKEEVFERFSPEAVQEAIDQREKELEEKARQAREEASRQEFVRQERARRKKRARRARTAVVTVALILGVATYLFIVLGLPELRYQTAKAAMVSGDLQTAREAFVALMDYRDAPDMIKECDLRTAADYVQTGEQAQVERALSMLTELDGYPGASEMMDEAHYQLARIALERKEYQQASDRLASLRGYRDADDLKNQADYQLALILMQKKDYEAAKLAFEALGGYKDAAAQAKECVYQPAMEAMAASDFDRAIDMFASIPGYRDSNEQRKQSIYRSALKSQLEGEYEFAYERFRLLGDYEDSSDQMKQSIYLAANEAKTAGKYDMAKELFETFPDYKDSADLAKECVYLPAVALMTEEKHDEAVKLFAQIPGYKDADDLYIQCIYRPAKAAADAGEYDEAIALFEKIPDYGDVEKLLRQAQYKRAGALEKAGDFEAAIDAYEALGDYSDAADRAKAATYAMAQEAFEAGQFANASSIFASLGKYSDAVTRVKECAYELALLVLQSGDLLGAYEALTAIEEHKPAEDKAKEIIYAHAASLASSGDLSGAAEAFALAGKYKDAADRRSESIYLQAAALMEEGSYQEAGALFHSISTYGDAKKKRDEAYDLWLAEKAGDAESMYDEGDFEGVVALLSELEIETLPKAYANVQTIYYDSNLKIARKLIEEDRSLEAYRYLIACRGFKNADELLNKNIYRVLGTWETEAGDRFAFYLNGTCVIKGEEFVFNMLNPYGISLGKSSDSLRRVYSYSNGGGSSKTMVLREDATEKPIRLTRVKQPELSPTESSEADLPEVDVETEEIAIGD